MHVPRRYGDDVVGDRHARDVEARREVDGRAHRAVFVQAQEVFFGRYGGRPLRVEPTNDRRVLDGGRLGVGAHVVDSFRQLGFGAPNGRLGERYAIDLLVAGACALRGEVLFVLELGISFGT